MGVAARCIDVRLVRSVLVTLLTLASASSAVADDLDSWEDVRAPTEARLGAATTLLPDGRVLRTGGRAPLTGGFGGEFCTAQSSTEIFDPRTGRWQPGPPMNERRSSHGEATTPEGRVLALGGEPGGPDARCTSDKVSTVEELDLASGLWRPRAPSSQPLGGVVPLFDGTLLSPGRRAERYDPRSNTWVDASTGRRGYGGGVALLRDGRVIAAGGPSGERGQYGYVPATGAVDLFDPTQNRWTPAASTDPRHNLAVALPDGRALTVGRYPNPAASISGDSKEIYSALYDPAADRWKELGQTPYGGPMMLLNTGRVFASSGGVFDPKTERWYPAAPRDSPLLYVDSLTRLADGRVLVIAANDRDRPTARIYTPGSDLNARPGEFGGAELTTPSKLPAGRLVLDLQPLRRGTLNGQMRVRARFRQRGKWVTYATFRRRLNQTVPMPFVLSPGRSGRAALRRPGRLVVKITATFVPVGGTATHLIQRVGV